MPYGYNSILDHRPRSLAHHFFDRSGGWPLGHIGEIEVVIGGEVQRAIDALLNDSLLWTAYLHLVPQPMDRGRLHIGILTLPILDTPDRIAIRIERCGGHHRSTDIEVE